MTYPSTTWTGTWTASNQFSIPPSRGGLRNGLRYDAMWVDRTSVRHDTRAGVALNSAISLINDRKTRCLVFLWQLSMPHV